MMEVKKWQNMYLICNHFSATNYNFKLRGYNYLKNRLIVFIVILLSAILSGCSRVALLNFETSRDNKQYREMVNNVFAALDSNSKEDLKELFAPNVISSNANIDKQLDELFEFYKGPKESDEDVTLIHSSEHNEYGRKEIELENHFMITADGVKYYVYLDMYSRNDNDKEEKGIHMLEFATEEAHDSKYFIWHQVDLGDIPGLYIQTSTEKRSDIMMADSILMKYKAVDRKLCADDFLDFVKKNDDFGKLTESIGEANGNNFDLYYFEISENQFVVCGVTNEKIKYMYVADEDKEIDTLWLADDMMKVYGHYLPYTPADRELTEEYFKSFMSRSNRLEQLVDEIGQPSGEEAFYVYFKLPDNRYAACYRSGDLIHSVFITDDDNKLYTIWEESSTED